MISESEPRGHNVYHQTSDVLVNGTLSLGERLNARIRHALEPARFPERRDVELAFAVIRAREGTAFFDHFWLDATTLWAVAAQIERGGLEGGIAATGLRQLLRALAAELDDPATVIAEAGLHWNGAVSALALVRLDTASGALRQAAEGRAASGPAERLAPGQVQWLVAGSTTLPHETDVSSGGLQALVDSHAGASLAVAAVLRFKAAAKKARTITLAVRNDRADVPDALAALRAFLGRHAVGDEDASMLELALDEILTNQINYGYRDGAAHEILVEIRVEEDDRLEVEIRDDGMPFDPLSVAAPNLDASIEERQLGGLGMHFVRSVVDEVRYRRSAGWNVLALGKRLGNTKEKEKPA